MKSELLHQAIRFAVDAHGTSLDKGGFLYVLHPLAVMAKAKPDIEVMCVGVLHDVIEDCHKTPEDLFNIGMTENIVKGILAVSRMYYNDQNQLVFGTFPNDQVRKERYRDFVLRSTEDEIGVLVKYWDLEHNFGRIQLLSKKERDFLASRYMDAKDLIKDAFQKAYLKRYNVQL